MNRNALRIAPAAVGSLFALFVASAAHAQAATTIDLQPSAPWAIAGSGVGPTCPTASPEEIDWAPSGTDGVQLEVIGTDVTCCDCVRRSAVFAVGTTTIAGTHLHGKFASTNAGTYGDGTFRVILYDGTDELGHKVYATQQRANNNCAGSDEEPETIVSSNETFDIDLTTLNGQENTTFDSLQIELLGYACGTDGSASALLQSMTLTGAVDGGTVGPSTPTNITAPPWANDPGPSDSGVSTTPVTSDGGVAASPSKSGGSSGCSLGPSSGGSSFAALALVIAAAVGVRVRRRRA